MTHEPTSSLHDDLSRRGFVKVGAAGLGAAMAAGVVGACAGSDTRRREHALGPAPAAPLVTPPMDVVRIGFVGVGGMGSVHVGNLLDIEGVEMRAICDIVEAKVARWQDEIEGRGLPRPTGYSRGERDFERLCAEEDLDLVYTATPWRWHVPVCVAAMRNGKHAATEVPAAVTLDECWELVETAEATSRHCLMMENVSYGRPEMMMLNMVRQGLLGELLHAECGYLHDLRAIKFSSTGEGLWRREHSKTRNGNLYPTHGLGPIAQCMDINRGDQFKTLVSMSSPSRGLQLYAAANFPEDSPQRAETYVLGDVNVSLIRTELGRTIFVSHDTNLPRPYSRINLLQGTAGIFKGFPDQVHLEGRSPPHSWEPASRYYDGFEHPLWKAIGRTAPGRGHGGMDYLEDYRLIQCLRRGEATDSNVYDAAALSVVSALSEASVANGSAPQEFPDFTRGRWREYAPLEIVEA